MLNKIFRKEFVFCAALGANVNNADEWLKYADKEMRGDKSRGVMVMTIKTPNWTRTLEIESDVEGKKQALSTILAPAKEKGIRTLRIENNMWNYFPKLKRKVAVSSSMLLASWMGSDFTNDDVLKSSSMSEDYSHKFIADEGEYKVIENTAKTTSKVMWPKITSYSSKTDCLPRIYNYYDKENKLRRVLTLSELKTFDGHKFLTHWEMKPQDDATKSTVLDYKSMEFNPSFKPGHFTQQNLTGK
ncbi:MAG TPA: outer membrane lipoprotein-sorting protein [Bacteriovoracaceae bacterium]|nr:outer membrane lipoprotein-sorting protein [Bacteriovoracaceae bacterium]